MNKDILIKTAKAMVPPGKGLLAADESLGTMEKRFKSINLESTEENRRAYREMLFTTPGVEEFISGVILFDETIRQKAGNGTLFTEILKNKGIIPGIKVDEGTEPLEGSPEEKITKGLEGLPDRLAEYAKRGARFAKWRAVIGIGQAIPTDRCIQENAVRLAQYAFDCQTAGLVPIIEPEVLLDGGHSIERCEAVSMRTLKAVFDELKNKNVSLEGLILKASMVMSGKDCPVQADVKQVAEVTLRTLKATVPSEVPGVVFLSGGQDDLQATARLNEMSVINNVPWQVTFCYGRGLLGEALKTWLGKGENVIAGQKAFYRRAKLNSLARMGKYSPEMEGTNG